MAAWSSLGELYFSFSHSYGYKYFMYLNWDRIKSKGYQLHFLWHKRKEEIKNRSNNKLSRVDEMKTLWTPLKQQQLGSWKTPTTMKERLVRFEINKWKEDEERALKMAVPLNWETSSTVKANNELTKRSLRRDLRAVFKIYCYWRQVVCSPAARRTWQRAWKIQILQSSFHITNESLLNTSVYAPTRTE